MRKNPKAKDAAKVVADRRANNSVENVLRFFKSRLAGYIFRLAGA